MIAHVALEVREQDAEACVRFWALLGFARVQAPEALRARATWVQAGTTQIHLLYADAPTAPPEGHVAVTVADFEATMGALRDAGFDAHERARHWGSPRAFARSPSGHRVELMAYGPGDRA